MITHEELTETLYQINREDREEFCLFQPEMFKLAADLNATQAMHSLVFDRQVKLREATYPNKDAIEEAAARVEDSRKLREKLFEYGREFLHYLKETHLLRAEEKEKEEEDQNDR